MRIPEIPNPFDSVESIVDELYELGYFIPIMVSIIIIVLLVLYFK